MFNRRADTTLISANAKRNTVRRFIKHIENSDSISRPVDDHLIAAHANSQGFLFITLFRGQKGKTQYETIQASMGDPSKSIAIEDATIGYSSGDPITKAFHIKGCNIGQSPPFLSKLKAALGGHVEVTAPKHFHHLDWTPHLGVFEGMSYEFNINRKDPFTSKSDVLSAFKSGGFTRYDGSAVPNDQWKKWLPRKLSKAQLKKKITLKRSIRVTLGMTIGKTKTLANWSEFRVRPNIYVYTIGYPSADRKSVV